MLKLRSYVNVSTTRNPKNFLHGGWMRWETFFSLTFQEQKLRSSINRDPQSPLQTIEVIYEEKLKREEWDHLFR